MKRNAISDLIAWKSSEDRKPLVLKGARQVGKTWLMKEFGKNYYQSYAYFNFDEEEELKSVFDTNKNPERIIELLSLIEGKKILPGKTLIIFDEIQECPSALNALKYFKEKASEYHVIAAGSLLGTSLAQPKSYPVGMINLLNIYPMTFSEYLAATAPSLYAYYCSIEKEQFIEPLFHNRLLETYDHYLIIGGMPECVSSWIKHKDPAKILRIQQELIEVYENDFSKHNGKVNSGRILMVFRSITTQLAKANEKFMYGAVREGGRPRALMEAELDASLGYEKNQKGDLATSNKRNGHSPKTLKSQYGEFQVDVPRDRNGEFEPKLIPKYQRDISGIEEKVISLYVRGMSENHLYLLSSSNILLTSSINVLTSFTLWTKLASIPF